MVKDRIGQEFGSWTVISLFGVSKFRQALWLCRCKCGTERVIPVANLVSGRSKSCGCEARENALKHGHARAGRQTPTYQSWCHMIQRCYNPKSKDYPDYGGRGIKVCSRWRKFENFLADMGECPKGLTIHRKENDGNYCLDNCKWATDLEQARNRSGNRVIDFNGESHCVSEWAEIRGWNVRTLISRLFRNWSIERALTEPLGEGRRKCRKSI